MWSGRSGLCSEYAGTALGTRLCSGEKGPKPLGSRRRNKASCVLCQLGIKDGASIPGRLTQEGPTDKGPVGEACEGGSQVDDRGGVEGMAHAKALGWMSGVCGGQCGCS